MHLNEFRDTLERIKRLKDIQYNIDKEIEYICKSNGIIHNLKKIGFTVEGYARDYLFLNGKWQDHVLTSLINPSFEF